jgi:hypothetical protein
MARIKCVGVGVDTDGVYLPVELKGSTTIRLGATWSAAFGNAQLDPPAVPAGEKFDVKEPLADFRPTAHQHPPPTAYASNPQVLHAKGLKRTLATKTGAGVCYSHLYPLMRV